MEPRASEAAHDAKEARANGKAGQKRTSGEADREDNLSSHQHQTELRRTRPREVR